MAGPLDLLQSWIFWRFPLLRPPIFDDIEWPLVSRWYRYLPTSNEKDPQLQRLRRQLDLMPFSEFVCLPYRTLEVEAVLDRRILQEEHRAHLYTLGPLSGTGWSSDPAVWWGSESSSPGPKHRLLTCEGRTRE
ncbi:hypothetical protein PIB30_106116 [Stylosanthes scabra]|uniref:Aminotransferase-like plant mobile domain-containing protein n=1 Tax=Stylosanthes scabra TaxID=79078 RepID=A0ABU6T092_9FABA|nr:hypothetical protein [Stylosanthes scabra]